MQRQSGRQRLGKRKRWIQPPLTWVVVGSGLVDHDGILGIGAEDGQHYSCGETGVRPREGGSALEGDGAEAELWRLSAWGVGEGSRKYSTSRRPLCFPKRLGTSGSPFIRRFIIFFFFFWR